MALESRKSSRLEDPGADLLDQMTTFQQRYGRIALGVLGVAAAIAIVVFFTVRTRAQAEAQAAEKLAQADALFWQGNYQQSMVIAKQVYDQWGSTPSGLDAHRLAGDDAFWNGDFKTAIAEYRRYLDRDKKGLLADAANRSLAYALESDHQYAAAAPIYGSLAGRFDRESSGEMLFAQARCLRAGSRPAEAQQVLRRIVDEYGETSYAQRARVELAELTVH